METVLYLSLQWALSICNMTVYLDDFENWHFIKKKNDF